MWLNDFVHNYDLKTAQISQSAINPRLSICYGFALFWIMCLLIACLCITGYYIPLISFLDRINQIYIKYNNYRQSLIRIIHWSRAKELRDTITVSVTLKLAKGETYGSFGCYCFLFTVNYLITKSRTYYCCSVSKL